MAIGERKKCTPDCGKSREAAEQDSGNWVNQAKGRWVEVTNLGKCPLK